MRLLSVSRGSGKAGPLRRALSKTMGDASTSKQQVPRLAPARPEAGRGKKRGRSLGMTILILIPIGGPPAHGHSGQALRLRSAAAQPHIAQDDRIGEAGRGTQGGRSLRMTDWRGVALPRSLGSMMIFAAGDSFAAAPS